MYVVEFKKKDEISFVLSWAESPEKARKIAPEKSEVLQVWKHEGRWTGVECYYNNPRRTQTE